MFFKKFFAKSFEQTIGKGDSCFKEDRYSEARQYYFDALEKTDGTTGEQQNIDYINSMIKKCGNNLAEMNIIEAEAAIRSCNAQKAAEYLHLSLELADDVTIREKTEKLISTLNDFSTPEKNNVNLASKHGCSSCGPDHHSTTSHAPIQPDHLQSDEQFLLLSH